MSLINKENINFKKSIYLTEEFCKINTYELEGKIKIVNLIKYILEKETKAEIKVSLEDAPYLIARLKGKTSNYRLLLEGHLDVVKANDEMFNIYIKDDVMYGRGTVDMKGGCVSILMAFINTFKYQKLDGDLYLVFTTDEEYSGETIKKILENKEIDKVDFAIIPEPTNCQIYNSHKGEAWIQVEFFGKAAHSSIPDLGKSAIYMATDYIYKVQEHIKTYKEDEVYGKEVLTVGVIEGGKSPNVVPDYAKLIIDKRYSPKNNIQTTIDELENILELCKKEDNDFDSKLTILGNWDSLYTNPANDDFKIVHKTIDKELNQKTSIGTWSAWGEGGYINKYNIPTIYFGPGETRFAHTSLEQININDIENVSKVYYEIIKELCK